MLKVLICFFLLVGVAFPKSLVKSLENRKTGESLNAFCESFSQEGKCKRLSIEYHSSVVNNKIISFNSNSSKENIIDKLIYHLEIKQMLKNKYKFFKTFRKVCEIGWLEREDVHNYNDNAGCLFKLGFISAVLVASVTAGLPVAAIAKATAVTSAASSVILKDLSGLQYILFYPALAWDGVRALTVFPVKKIINTVQTRTLKRKIIPFLEDFKYELLNPPSEKELEDEEYYDMGNHRVVVLKNRHFKRIMNSFNELMLATQMIKEIE